MFYGGIETTLARLDTHFYCGNCNKLGTTYLFVKDEYFHAMFIPVFSTGKEVYSLCRNCDLLLRVEQMPNDILFEAKKLKKKTKIPYWHYSGILVLITLFISFFIFQVYIDTENNKKELNYLSSPIKGDIYKFRTGEGLFHLIKVDSISLDSIFIKENIYKVEWGVDNEPFNIDSNFINNHKSLFRGELEKMYLKRRIIYIIRNDSL